MAASAGSVAPVIAAESPRLMIAAFSRAMAVDGVAQPLHVVEGDVGDRGTPPCHTLVASSRPPRPTSTTATSTPARAEPSERRGREDLELGRRRRAAPRPVRLAEHLVDDVCEVGGRDQLAVDDDPLAVAHEVRLRRLADAVTGLAQHRRDQRLDAALAVRPADQRPAQADVRIAQPLEQRPSPAEAKPDAESTARLKSAEDVPVTRVGVLLQ